MSESVTESELIAKIKELEQIKPRKDWVVLTKRGILTEEKKFKWASILEVFPRLFQYKPALATITVLGILIAAFISAQSSLPGDFLYPLKRITEKSRVIFVSEKEKPQIQLQLTNKRLEELTKIAQTNQVKKLAPAIEEYQASVIQATEDLKKMKETPQQEVKKIVQEAQKIEEKKQELEETYGVAGLEGDEESDPTKVIVGWLIKDLEEETLSESQQAAFEEAKEDYQAGDYSQALEKILILSNN